MIKILLYFTLLLIFISLTACQRNVSEEVLEYQPRSDIYARFASDPQQERKALVANHGQGIAQLLQGILLSEATPSEATLKAFSRLFAEAYRHAVNPHLSPFENKNHARILGTIVGELISVRNQVVAERKARSFAMWYDYTALDKRWLGLLTDIIPLALAQELPEQIITVARTGAVEAFAASLLQTNYAHHLQDNNDDLVNELLYQLLDTAVAKFNGYEEQTGRDVGNSFKTAFSFVNDVSASEL